MPIFHPDPAPSLLALPMCGRYTHKYLWREIRRLLDLMNSEEPVLPPSFNVAPTQTAPMVWLADDSRRELVMARWGLVPSWADDPKIGNTLINARSETAATKPAFRSAFKRHRCIVPVSGFYEWQKCENEKSPKQPFYIYRADGEIACFAGLFELWKHEGQELLTYTILTTAANAFMAKLHDRMPVMLEVENVARWLDPKAGPDDLAALLKPAADGVLAAHPVSRRVNSPKNNDATLLEALVEQSLPPKPDGQGGLFG